MKQLAVNIFKFYIFINIHVALSVVALYLVFNTGIDMNYLAFLFFSTISGYNFIRFFNFNGNRFFIKKFIARHKYVVLTTVAISSLLSIYYYFQLNIISQISLVPFFMISFFYNYHFKFAPVLKLRNNGIVKILSVALVWSGLVIGVPAIAHGKIFRDYILRFIWIFLYVLMLTLSFDQRDLYIDKAELGTIPQLYREKLLSIYVFLNIILISLSYFIFSEKDFVVSTFIFIFSAYLCYRSNEYKSYYYTAFLIEAIPVLWLAIHSLIS